MRAVLLLTIASSLWGQVTFNRILNANKEPQNWLTYSGTELSQRYSLLNQITPENVKNLELQWVFQARSLEKFEATPLVVDGVLYTVQAPNDVVAIDAVTGRVFWVFEYAPSPEARVCCGRVNRGLAILGDTLFMGTIDGHLLALDAKSGKPIWNVTVAKAEAGYSLMHAPLVVKDKVIVGVAGGEFGIRGFLAAYDARTGKLKWYFQFSPHDDFDFDSVQVPVLADMEWKGKMRRVMLWANRNGFYYVLDRTTGEFLQGKPFAKVTWTTGLDDSGHPVRVASANPTREGTLTYPGVQGATNWFSP